MKLKEKIEQWGVAGKERAGAAKTYACKHPYKTTALILTPPALVAALVKLIAVTVDLLTMTAEAVAAFLNRYFIMLVIAAVAVGWLADRHSKRKAEREARKLAEEERKRAHNAQLYATTKDATYNKEGKVVLSVARDMGSMGIVPPNRLCDITSPSRTTSIEGGAGMLCQFLIPKARGAEVDADQFRSTMQTKVDQRLSAGEWPEIKAQHIYDGRVYSGFVIHAVRDTPGSGFLEVWTALVNDAYCRYAQKQELDNDTPPPDVDRLDPDYGN